MTTPEPASRVRPQAGHAAYRPDIDGLRAVSVLAVVLYHAGLPGFAGGYVGVDVFFVISGYLITGILGAELQATGRLSFLQFYARRVRRLIPALLVVVLATLALSACFLGAQSDRQQLGLSALASMAMAANVFFYAHTGGYFDGPAEFLPLLHLWSLGVEEQFYVVWPLLLLLALRSARAGRFRPRAAMWALGLALVSLAAAEYLVRTGQASAAFYMMPFRLWELAAGALLALAPGAAAGRPIAGRVRQAAGLAGLALILAPVHFYGPGTAFPGLAALPPVAGAMLVIASGSGQAGTWTGRLLACRPLVHIGLLSYGWYLWHWPLLAIARSYRLGEPAPGQDLTLAILALLLAHFTLRGIEMPLREKRIGGSLRPAAVVGWGAFGCAAVAASALALLLPVPTSGPAFDFQRERNAYRQQCHMGRDWNGELALPRCRVPAAAGQAGGRAVVVWGDSYADAWFPMALRIGERYGADAVQLSMSGCPPLLGLTPGLVRTDRPRRDAERRKEANCPRFNQAVVDYLGRLPAAERRDTSVLLAARWAGRMGARLPLHDTGVSGYFDATDASREDSLRSLEKGLRATLDALARLGSGPVAIILPGPEFRYSVEECLARRSASACGSSRAAIDAYTADVSAAIRRVAAGRPGVRLLDPLPFFCTSDECPAIVSGVPAAYDAYHPSASAARRFADSAGATARWLASGQDATPESADRP